MAATLEALLPFQGSSGATQLQQGLAEGHPLQLIGLQQRGQPTQQGALLHHQLVGEQPGQVQIPQIEAGILAAVDRLEPAGAEVFFLQGADGCPEQTVGLEGEVVEFALAQLHPYGGAVGGAMQVEPQQLGFGPLPQARLAGLFPLLGAAVPALALHLLAQVVLQLQRQAGLAATEPLGHPLQVVAAHGALGQLAQQGHQGRHRLLELVRASQVAALQHLLDLPVEPEGSLIQQGAIVAGPLGF